MVKVKMLTGISGTRDGVDWPGIGESVDLPADEAAHMVAAGHAEAVGARESAAAGPAENAAAKRPSRRT